MCVREMIWTSVGTDFGVHLSPGLTGAPPRPTSRPSVPSSASPTSTVLAMFGNQLNLAEDGLNNLVGGMQSAKTAMQGLRRFALWRSVMPGGAVAYPRMMSALTRGRNPALHAGLVGFFGAWCEEDLKSEDIDTHLRILAGEPSDRWNEIDCPGYRSQRVRGMKTEYRLQEMVLLADAINWSGVAEGASIVGVGFWFKNKQPALYTPITPMVTNGGDLTVQFMNGLLSVSVA